MGKKRLQYVGSVVLGLNDALVELTGALAGLTLALQNTVIIAVTGFITGVAAAMSMAASEYLSLKAEHNSKNPLRGACYTGIAYMLTVLWLIMPYFVVRDVFVALGWTILNAVLVIACFNLYVAKTQKVSFRKRFLEMLALSMGVAIVSFLVGLLVRMFVPVDI